MRYISIILFLIPLACFSQTKPGGFFSRIDDPMVNATYRGKEYNTDDNADSVETYAKDSFNLKITFATVNEYPNHTFRFDTMQSWVKFYPEKLTHLQNLVADGHILATHTVNHTTNSYYTHIDSLSTADEDLVNNGYSVSDGIDTIIINNTDSPIYVWYWHHLPDGRYTLHATDFIEDGDGYPDSIYYRVLVPRNAVFFGIYPNSAGLKKIITEASRRFVASGLSAPTVFIHPGQEYSLELLDTLTENYGYVETFAGTDSVNYHIQNYLSSNRIVCGTNNKIKFNDTTWSISDTTMIKNDSVWGLNLTGYTADGSEFPAYLKPSRAVNWMWRVDPDTIIAVSNDLNLISSAVYPNGRQYVSCGFNPSSAHRNIFAHSQQWGHILMYNEPITADSAIDILCSAHAKHYFISTNDHGYNQGGLERVDSFYTFISDNNIPNISMAELPDSVYSKPVNVYENILPKFDLNLNGDESPDGWNISNAVSWTQSGVDFDGDTTYLTITTANIQCNYLWGLEKGENMLSIYMKSSTADSVRIVFDYRKHTDNTDNNDEQVSQEIKYIHNMTSNWNEHFAKITVPDACDFVNVSIYSYGGNTDISKPRLRLYNSRYTKQNYIDHE